MNMASRFKSGYSALQTGYTAPNFRATVGDVLKVGFTRYCFQPIELASPFLDRRAMWKRRSRWTYSCTSPTGFLSKWFFKQTRQMIKELGLIHERMEMQFAKIVIIS
jgi:hypothetical protein